MGGKLDRAEATDQESRSDENADFEKELSRSRNAQGEKLVEKATLHPEARRAHREFHAAVTHERVAEQRNEHRAERKRVNKARREAELAASNGLTPDDFGNEDVDNEDYHERS